MSMYVDWRLERWKCICIGFLRSRQTFQLQRLKWQRQQQRDIAPLEQQLQPRGPWGFHKRVMLRLVGSKSEKSVPIVQSFACVDAGRPVQGATQTPTTLCNRWRHPPPKTWIFRLATAHPLQKWVGPQKVLSISTPPLIRRYPTGLRPPTRRP